MKPSWIESTLGETCEIYQPKTITAKEMALSGNYPVFGANGVIGRHDKFNHEESQILVTCRGATCGTVNISEPFSWITGNAMVVRPKTGEVEKAFLAYALRGSVDLGKAITGAAQPQITRANLSPLRFCYPDLAEQRRIVDLLSRAEGIVRMRRRAKTMADAIIPAVFLDMFGDPLTNPKGLPVVALSEVATIQGGLQVTRARVNLPLERPYLRVANVYRARLSLSEIKTIRLTDAEYQRTRLVLGDLLFVEGHGNPQEVGRVAIWDNSIEGCTHQNHLIRARPDIASLLPIYACYLLNSAGGRQSLLRAGKTTSGLSTISTQNVKEAEVLLAPMSEQQAFARRVEAIDSIIKLQRDGMAKAEATFNALMARAFSAESGCHRETTTEKIAVA